MSLWINDLVQKNKFSRPAIKLDSVQGIVMHWTANKGADDEDHANFFDGADGGGSRYASAHLFVDSDSARLIIPLNEMAYHANEKPCKITRLGKNANHNTLGIEMCVEKDGTISPLTVKRCVDIVAELCKTYKLDPLLHVYRHHDITGKNCPAPWVEKPELFTKFKKDVKARMTPKPVAKPVQKGYTGNSLVDYLKSVNKPTDFISRRKLAEKYGVKHYTGTPAENLLLLDKLRKK